MAQTGDGRAILANVQAEVCLEANAQTRFFTDLAVLLHATAPASSADARAASRQVVMDARAELLCLGRRVGNERFQELVCLQRPSSLEYCIPKDWREGSIGSGTGLTADVLLGEDREVVATFLEGYDGPVDTSNRFGITWGADMAEVSPVLTTRPSAELRSRLGLAGWEEETFALLLSYPRTEVADALHVPRVFEGIDLPAFALEADCAAPVGRTKPLTGDPAAGFSEAVHRGGRVRPSRFETIMLNE